VAVTAGDVVSPRPSPSPGSPLVEHRSHGALMQRAGYPAHLARFTYGGPVAGKDVRLVLDRRGLAALTEASSQSTTARARCDGAALFVEVYRGGDGNVVEFWSPLAARVAPEPVGLMGDADLPDLDLDAELREFGGHPPVVSPPLGDGGKRGARALVLLGRSVWVPHPALRPRWLIEAGPLRAARLAAEASITGRAVMHGVGVQVDVYAPTDGRSPPYEVWTLLANGAPTAESVGVG
jgi:hypothetical protein